MSRIRVLQIVAGLDIGHTFGGAERSGLELARALDRDQFEVSVCSFWRCDTPAEKVWQTELESEGIAVFYATPSGARRNSVDFFSGANRIVSYCRDHAFDIIHAHHEGGALAALLARSRGTTTAAMRTGHLPLGNEWGKGVVNWMLRAIMSHIVFPLHLDAEVSISQERRDMLDRRWVAQRFHRHASLIHNARSLTVSKVETRAQRPAVIGCVARLSAEKGVDRLLDAMQCVLARRDDVELMIVGDGPLRVSLQTLAINLGIQEKVRFLGQRDDVPAMLKHMSLFVLPSLYEGVSTALLEAIAAGVPVVASDVAGNRAIIEHGRSGWLASTAKAETFADVIIAALSDPTEGALRAEAAQRVLSSYSIEAAAQSYAALYKQLVAQRRVQLPIVN